MAVTTDTVVLPITPFSATAVAVTAETSFHNPTNMVTLVSDSGDNTNGLRISSLYAITRASMASDINCQLYTKVGSTYTLIDSVKMTDVDPSGTVANAKARFEYSEDAPLILEAGVGLAVAIGVTTANGVVFFASGGAY